MPPSSVHFNGSVNLPDAETVMREISSRIPAGVRRMTDGETGERNYWIHFQIQKFLAMPELESLGSGQAYETDDASAPAMPQLRRRLGSRRREPATGASAPSAGWAASPPTMFRRCSISTVRFSSAQTGNYGIRPPVIGLSGLTGCAPPTALVPGPSRGSR